MISKSKRQIHANVCYMEFGHFRIKSDFEFAKLGLFFQLLLLLPTYPDQPNSADTNKSQATWNAEVDCNTLPALKQSDWEIKVSTKIKQ